MIKKDMVNRSTMAKIEREGKIGPFGGKKSNETTERYEFLRDATKSAYQILGNAEACTANNLANVDTGKVVLNDLSDSDAKKFLHNLYDDATSRCSRNQKNG